jgi:hypothetical protein
MSPRDLPFPRSLPEFQKLFPDDAHCAAYMERVRWPGGFVCPSCAVASMPLVDATTTNQEMTMKRINVTTTAYEGDVAFPEADSYPEFVAEELTRCLGVQVDCSVGGFTTKVSVYGYGEEDTSDLENDVTEMVQQTLWEDFCRDGYKAYSAPAA